MNVGALDKNIRQMTVESVIEKSVIPEFSCKRMVDIMGIEPMTFSMQSRRSTPELNALAYLSIT